jgi:nitrous oxide reductase accessory protein NosL
MGYYVYLLHAMKKQNRIISVNKISVVDYATFGTPNEHMIDVDRDNTNAWFAFTDKKVKGANAPYVFAFETKDAAEEFTAKNGGRVKDYAGVLTVLARGLNEDKDAKPDEFGKQLMSN